MNIKDCQHEMRVAFLGGFAGRLISGLIWLVASLVSLGLQPRYAMAVLFLWSCLVGISLLVKMAYTLL